MKRKYIDEMTYKDFLDWANCRASDGAWSLGTAIAVINVIKEVEEKAEKSIFPWRKEKNKNLYFHQHRENWFDRKELLEWE